MSVSLYRKYRPQDFSSVVGQKAAVDVLTNAITKGRVGHAYLFSGSRGCGKTSIARIFAKALNCLDPQGYEPCGKCINCQAITSGESLDVIEIDGASNNGVENIRSLRENIALAPFSSAHKIYIIDEVHMLSQGAFNALLKTLEEPPEHAIFIMATTEPHKVPVTIRSRCQHIPFHSISPEDIYSRLEYVCSAEGVKAESDALWEISRQAEGALRDALSLLEQVIASGEVSLQNVEAVLGAGSRPAFERWVKTLRTGTQEAYTAIKSMIDAGASGVRVFEEMFSLVRNMWLVSKWKNIAESLGLSSAEKTFLLDEVNNWRTDELHVLLNNILQALTKARQGVRPDILLGMFMLSLEVPAQTTQPVISAAPQNPRESPEPPEPRVSESVPESVSAPANYDLDLKDELLRIAHDVDFVLYCALFNVNAFLDTNNLILDVMHPYCYDKLKVDANNATLKIMFKKYDRVILRHNGNVTECQVLNNLLEELMPPQAQSVPEGKPTLDVFPEVPSVEPENTSSPHETELYIDRKSVFDEYRRELAILGANPEVILRKRREQEDQEEEQDEDNDLPQEGESEE